MGRLAEDMEHELKMIARGESMIKKARERLALLRGEVSSFEAGLPAPAAAQTPPNPKLNDIRERVRKIVRAPGYVSKYR